MTLNTPRLRRRCHELSNSSAVAEGSVATEVLSCMRLYTLTGVAVENSYILSRRLRHHCAIINYRVLRRLRRHHRSLRHRFFVVFISL